MWSELLRARRDPRRCAFEVRNEKRDLLFVLPFDEVIESCRDRSMAPVQQNIERATATLNHHRRLSGEFIDALNDVRKTLTESRALLQVEV